MKNLKHTAELALIRAIPELTIGELKKGRQKTLFKKLQKAVDIDLQKLPRLSNKDLDIIWNKVEKFGTDTGWLKQKKHAGTLISFCLAIIEKSEFKFNKKIITVLNDLIDFFERVGDLKIQSCWSGNLAADKWEKLFIGNNI